MIHNRPIIFDVTRLIATGWSGKQATGIDRVCEAYLNQYRERSYAMFQHRGVFRVLNASHSDAMFSLLTERAGTFKSRLLGLASSLLANSASTVRGADHLYLNVSQTDGDLVSHWNWIKQCQLTSIHMVHDLIPILNPNYCSLSATHRHTGRVTSALRQADGIITNSNATTHDLTCFAADHNIAPPPILTAHLGVELFPVEESVSRDTTGHFVFVGTFEARKNHQLLARIWQKLVASKRLDVPHLVLIGQESPLSRSLKVVLDKDPALRAKVKIINNCDDAEMSRWVRSAAAVLIPSLDEGFGLPLAEAMALGIPSIASDLPSFREIGQDIPLYIPAEDESAWERAITNFIECKVEANRQRLRLAGYKPLAWQQHFLSVDAWFTSLPRRHAASASSNVGSALKGGAPIRAMTATYARGKMA